MAKKTAKKKNNKSEAVAKEKARRQRSAVITFAVGILLLFLTFIKGDGLWRGAHNLMFGLLGWSAYFVAPLCIYLAILATKESPMEEIKKRGWQAGVLILLISGAIEVFGGLPEVEGIARMVKELFREGMEKKGGGIAGFIFAGPLSFIGSSPIPQIIILIILFIFIMLVTGSSLMRLFNAVRKPVDSIGSVVENVRNGRAESREAGRQLDELHFTEVEPEPEVQNEKMNQFDSGEFFWNDKSKTEPKFNIDIDISDDKPPEELEKQVPMETIIDDFKDISFTQEIDQVPKVMVKKDPLEDWGIDRPVEFISFKPEESVEDFGTGELPSHPLYGDIDDAEEDDLLRTVQSYLDSIKSGDPVDIPAPVQQKPEKIEVETFTVDLEDVEPAEEGWAELVKEAAEREKEFSTFEFDTPVPKLQPQPPEAEFFAENTGFSQHTSPKMEEARQHRPAPVKTPKLKEEVVFSDGSYRLPPVDLLEKPDIRGTGDVSGELRENAEKLVSTLDSFGVKTKIIDVARGPSVTRYELQPSPGVKISRITGLADDIALNLAAAGIRIEAPIPGKPAVGIEVPNKTVSLVRLREIVDSKVFQTSSADIAMALGKDITGSVKVADISKMPHVLIAGATGSGKSVCINSIIMSVLYKYSPEEVKLLMIDPKVVELGVYNGIPHLLVPVVTDPKKAAGALSWAVTEMLKRYKTFAENSVRDITGYNKLCDTNFELEPMPKVVVIIDELADLMMAAPNEVEDSICRLAQMARAAGMHLVIATQRPSVDVITGVIKANIPSRIAFAVSSQVDSRTILDSSGAEKLLGRGDMLFYPVGAAKPTRVQGCFVTDKEVEKVVEHIKKEVSSDYNDEIAEEIERLSVSGGGAAGPSSDGGGFDDEDELIPYAIECIIEAGQGSTSLLQRRLKIGYARAARIIDQLEARGIVGPFEGSKPRQLMITKDQYMEMKLAGHDMPNAGVPLDETQTEEKDD